jgi:hypothetical protein
MVSFSNGDSTMFCSRKIVPPGSVMRLRLVAKQLRGDRERIGEDVEIGVLEELDQRVGRRAAVDDDALAGDDQRRRGRAMARFCGTLTSWLIANGMPTRCG